MATPLVEIRFNDKKFGPTMLVRLEGKAEKAVRQTTSLVEAAAARKAPEKTSNLVNSITSIVTGKGFDTVGKVKATARYAIFVHEGTGIFGPLGAPIIPQLKKALYWEGAAHPVKSVRGMKPRPFLKEAFDEEGDKLFDLVLK